MKNITKRFLILFSLILIFSGNLFARSKQNSQVIEAGHWIYEDLALLSSEAGYTFYLEAQPLTVGEIKHYLYGIDYGELSESGKVVYEKVDYYLELEDNFWESDAARTFINLQLSPEGYYKSNKNIDWSFKNKYREYAITFPIILGFSDMFTIQTNPVVTKSALVMDYDDNFTNVPYEGYMMDFYLPKIAYASFAKMFDEWGFSFHIGHEGMQVGQTSMDSVVYSRNFETDLYTQLSFFNEHFKYSLNVNQIEKDRYLYLHQLILRPFKNFNVGCVEGSMLNAPFELRYLNPLMFMHQFASWYDYDDYSNATTGEYYKKYNEGRFCAFLGFTMEYIPFKNMRIYGLYGQNEILDAGGSRSQEALSVPDSIAAQLGIEYNIPLPNKSFLKTGIEALYTSPYYMIKQSPDWSLYRSRNNVQRRGNIVTWMGSPFGPDNFSVQARVKYEPNHKWSVGANVLFAVNGENNDYSLFTEDNKTHVLVDKNNNIIKNVDGLNPKFNTQGHLEDSNGNEIKDKNGNVYTKADVSKQWYWNYYPSVRYQDETDKVAVVEHARNMWMSGVREYKTQINVNGHYKILDNLDLYGQLNYTFVFNNNNVTGDFQHGVETVLGCCFNLF